VQSPDYSLTHTILANWCKVLADTSLTLTGRYNQKPRETPERKIRRKYAESAARRNAPKALGTDS